MSAYAPHKYNPWEMPEEELDATFIGRQALLDRLLEAVREQSQAESIQHYILLGPRGIGKTSLLLLLRRRLKRDEALSPRWLCVHFREEEFYVYTLRDLLALALESLYADEGVAEAKPLLDEAQAEPDDEKSQAILLDGVRRISQARGQRILLLVDNLDQFLRALPGRAEVGTFQHALRRLLSTDHFLMLIGTSTQHFDDFASYDEAFFNFFCPITVGNLSDDEVDELLMARARFDDNREFIQDYESHKANVRTITFLTGGNPRLVLMLYEILSQHRILPVVHALRQIVDNLTPLFKDVLEQMSRQQSKTLDAIMRLGGAGSPTDIASTARLALNVVTTMLGRLKESGFLASEGEGKGRPATYRVRDQMFRTWYQMRYLRPNRRRLELLSELLRAWFTASEREATIERLHGEFQKELADGLTRHAKGTALTMEYYAASLDGPSRARQMQRVAENYLTAGDTCQAGLAMAEALGIVGESQPRYESAGLAQLGHRLVTKADLKLATQAYAEALRKDKTNAAARVGLGVCHGLRGDYTAAANEFSAVVDLPDAPPDDMGDALFNRGVSKEKLGDTQGAIADYTAAIALPGALPDEVARALVSRGMGKGELRDIPGAISDYTAAMGLTGASPERVTQALVMRGMSKRELSDIPGAISDCTAAIGLTGAPPEQVTQALVVRGMSKGELGDTQGAVDDLTAAVRLPGAPPQFAALASCRLGLLCAQKGEFEDAVAHFSRSAESRASIGAVHAGVGGLAVALSALGKKVQLLDWLSRMDELEPTRTPTEDRLQCRIVVVGNVANILSLGAATEALAVMLKTPHVALRERLAFLVPALELARTGDEGVLAKLPEAERDVARRIAADICKARQGKEA